MRLESRMGDQLEELKRSANERESRLRDDLQRRIAELEKVPYRSTTCVCVMYCTLRLWARWPLTTDH